MDTTEIRKRAEAAIRENDYGEPVYGSVTYLLVTEDIPALLSEVDRLTSALAAKDDLIDSLRSMSFANALAYSETADENEKLVKELAAKDELLKQAVEDLYKACQNLPCNNGVCVTKNCTGNKIPCNFEWRGAKKGEG